MLVGLGGDALLQRALPDGRTALHAACYAGHLAVVEALAAAGGAAAIAREMAGGRTCLHVAAGAGHLAVFEALCRAVKVLTLIPWAHGAKINVIRSSPLGT